MAFRLASLQVQPLRLHALLLLLVTVGAGLAGFVWQLSRPVQYQATALLLFKKSDVALEFDPRLKTSSASAIVPSRAYQGLIKSPEIEQLVLERTREQLDPGDR